MTGDYQFDDLDSSELPESKPATHTPQHTQPMGGGGSQGGNMGGGDGGAYASEIYSKQIKAKFRTFFIDLKQSSNGKFVKISEKSHGRKSTIMMDAEDVPMFMEAMKEVMEKF